MNINMLIENLSKNGIDCIVVQNKSDVVGKVAELLEKGSTVAVGGSMSLFECGVIDFLRDGEFDFLDRYAENADADKIYRDSYSADCYLCSCNAITENGELYNVDGNSNRVSAIAFGAKSVIMVVGINKIVADLEQAIYRVKTVAAPKNCMRLGCNTYCKEKGQCQSLLLENPTMTDGCNGDSRICCNYLVSARQRVAGRIKVILMNEDVGY